MWDNKHFRSHYLVGSHLLPRAVEISKGIIWNLGYWVVGHSCILPSIDVFGPSVRVLLCSFFSFLLQHWGVGGGGVSPALVPVFGRLPCFDLDLDLDLAKQGCLKGLRGRGCCSLVSLLQTQGKGDLSGDFRWAQGFVFKAKSNLSPCFW